MNKRIGSHLTFAALLGTALFLGLLAAPTSSAETGVAEELRFRTEGDTTWAMRVLFDPAFGGDRAAVADAMGASQGFRQGPELTASYVANRQWAISSMPIQVRYNPDFDITQLSPVNGTPETVVLLGPLQRAISAWTAVPTLGLALEYVGTTTSSGIGCDVGTDGVNLVRFSATLPSGVLGRACTGSRTTFAGTFVFEFDMEIADDVSWSVSEVTPSSAFDLDSVVLHEVGHAVGLGHSAESSAVMSPTIARQVQRRTPTADDIAGIQSLYGTPPTPAPTATVTSAASTFPNSPYVGGLNSVVVLGSGTSTDIVARIVLDSGRSVTALWMLTSGAWLYYLPSAPTINGGLAVFPGPTAAVLVVLA